MMPGLAGRATALTGFPNRGSYNIQKKRELYVIAKQNESSTNSSGNAVSRKFKCF
jgi:hypothetical protein